MSIWTTVNKPKKIQSHIKTLNKIDRSLQEALDKIDKIDGMDSFINQAAIIKELIDQFIGRFTKDYDQFLKAIESTGNSNAEQLSNLNKLKHRSQKITDETIRDFFFNQITINDEDNENIKLMKGNVLQLRKNILNDLDLGHKILLDIRNFLDKEGTIDTKFIIAYEDNDGVHFYEIDEQEVKTDKILSTYGAGEISNPWSAAYSITKDDKLVKTLQDKGELIGSVPKEKDPGDDIIGQLWKIKTQIYTPEKNQYPYWDGTDAEIIVALKKAQENGETIEITDKLYQKARLIYGGNLPFYKGGDVGLTQVKFFNFSSQTRSGAQSNSRAANYARFSLIRDRMKILQSIFNILASGEQINENTKQYFKEQIYEFYNIKEGVLDSAVNKSFDNICSGLLNN